MKDVQAVCDELGLAIESVIPPRSMADSADLAERWEGMMANHMLHCLSWRQMPATLSRCTESLRFYRPDVSGMSVIVSDENLLNRRGVLRRRFKQYYGGMAKSERTMHHLKLNEEFEELRQKIIDIEPGTGVSEVVTSPHYVEWLPSWRPLWATHYHSEYGMFSLFHRADPEEIGGALQAAARCVKIVDAAFELIYAHVQVQRDVNVVDLQHRVSSIEARLFRASNNGAQEEQQHEDILQLPDVRRDHNQQA